MSRSFCLYRKKEKRSTRKSQLLISDNSSPTFKSGISLFWFFRVSCSKNFQMTQFTKDVLLKFYFYMSLKFIFPCPAGILDSALFRRRLAWRSSSLASISLLLFKFSSSDSSGNNCPLRNQISFSQLLIVLAN